jgi:hypothetical protein
VSTEADWRHAGFKSVGDRLFEEEEAVVHVMGIQIVEKKRRNPWTTRDRLGSSEGSRPGGERTPQPRRNLPHPTPVGLWVPRPRNAGNPWTSLQGAWRARSGS